MTEYHIKLDDNEATGDAVLKVLGTVYHKGYDVSLNAAERVITITTKEKDTRRDTVKKTLKEVHHKLFWMKVWRKFCDWYMRKGYWSVLIVCLPLLEILVFLEHDIGYSIMISATMEVWIIAFLISDERRK